MTNTIKLDKKFFTGGHAIFTVDNGTGTVTRIKNDTTWKFNLTTGRVIHGLRVTIQPRAVTTLNA